MGNRKYNNGLAPWDYISNISSLAGTGASIGGPAGAVLGGVLGAGMTVMQNRQLNDAKQAEIRNAKLMNNNALSGSVRSMYDMSGVNNTGVPGFKDGLSKFMPQLPGMPNAYVSNGEVMRNPMDGSLDKVPGEYNAGTPDDVVTSIMPGTSIYSADNSNKLPYGKSTPADIANKMAKAQRKSDEILNGKGSRLDKQTAKLNNKNINNQAVNLDKMTYLQQSYSNPVDMAKYKDGKPWFAMNRDKWASKTGINLQQGISESDIDEEYQNYLSSYEKDVKNKISSTISSIGAIAPVVANLTAKPEIEAPVYAQYMNPMATYNLASAMTDANTQSRIARYNQSTAGSASMPYGSAIYGQTLTNRAKLFDASQRFNAEQTSQYATRYNQGQQEMATERRRINDINARNRAVVNNMKSTGLSQLSQFAQTKELGKNQALRDKQQMAIYALMNSDVFSPEKIAEMYKILGLNK